MTNETSPSSVPLFAPHLSIEQLEENHKLPPKFNEYRSIFTESEKIFDPKLVYGDAPNPTLL